MCDEVLEWLPSLMEEVPNFKRLAVEGGEEDGSPVWLIQADYNGDVIPGKLVVHTRDASIVCGDKSHVVTDIQIACANAKKITWVAGSNGSVPSNAIIGGCIRETGEKLYVGRGRHLGNLIPGKIEPSQKVLYITYEGEVIKLADYEVMCLA